MPSVTAKVLAPKTHVMSEIMRAFYNLANDDRLVASNDFSQLDDIIKDTVVESSLLRLLYIEFLSNGVIELQIRFKIDWRRKSLSIESSNSEIEQIMIKKTSENAIGKDFVEQASPKLFQLFEYVRGLIESEQYDQANWTITLRGDERQANANIKEKCTAIEKKYGFTEPNETYLSQRDILEKSKPVKTNMKDGILSDMILRIIHRPLRK